MEIKEKLDLVEYVLKQYKDEEYTSKFTMLDYYSITDINMKDLVKIAQKNNRRSLAIALREYMIDSYYAFSDVKLEQRIGFLYSYKGKEMSDFDKIALYEILVDRGYPTINGVYDAACRYYASGNVDNLNKQDIQTKIKQAYCKAKGIPFELESKNNKEMVKTLKK